MAHDGPARQPSTDSKHTELAVVRGEAALDVAEAAFRLLATGPAGLAVDGRRVGHGLPRRRIPLTELAAVLMHPATSFAARDSVWRLLVTRARSGEAKWVVGVVGVALPGLRAAAGRLARRTRAGDVQAEVLAGFVAALRTIDLDAGRVCPRLCNAAYTAARAALRANEPASSGEGTFLPGSAVPPPPWGHPDLVLARAVRRKVLTAEEAELIAATRLEEIALADYAEQMGDTRWAAYKRRQRAEARLVAAIRSGELTDVDAEVIIAATCTTVAEPPFASPLTGR